MVLALASAFFVPVYGAEAESIQVHASWLDDEMLRIDVVDAVVGTTSSLAIRLSDFVNDTDNSRHIFIQAVDLDGNLSGVIQIDNPFYVPIGSVGTGVGGNQVANPPLTTSSQNDPTFGGSENTDIASTTPPQSGLTPDGTGTVVDNIVTQNELEFFTVFTEAGNVFYLVIDRQGNTDNVYLLNAVTEADLMALAERDGVHISSPSGGDGGSVSGIPNPPNQNDPSADGQAGTGVGAGSGEGSQGQPNGNGTQSDPNTDPASSGGGSGNGRFIFIIVAVFTAGGLAYYFKIVRGKKRSSGYDDEDEYDADDDEDWDYRGDSGYDDHDDYVGDEHSRERGDDE